MQSDSKVCMDKGLAGALTILKSHGHLQGGKDPTQRSMHARATEDQQ